LSTDRIAISERRNIFFRIFDKKSASGRCAFVI